MFQNLKWLLIKLFRRAKRHYRIIKAVFFSIENGAPESKLKFIGVTGTSGKTTTSFLIYEMLKNAGFKTGLVSTVAAYAGDEEIDTGLHVTTPDPEDLPKILKKMVDKGIEWVVVESSSHSLDQGRLGIIKFEYAVYTNITSDHLDYHHTWKDYAFSKFRLIVRLNKNGKAMLNKDDEKSYNFIKSLGFSRKSLDYSLGQIKILKEEVDSTQVQVDEEKFTLNLPGEYNVSNFLAAYTLGKDLGLTTAQICKALEHFKGVPGRMEIIQKEPFSAIVDFAHNGDSLERSLKILRETLGEENKIINIFGSAGLRDVKKRSEMGKISAKFADVTIITAEDPRIEKLFEINNEILEGAESEGGNLVKRFANHQEYLDFISSTKKFNTQKAVYIFDEESVDSRFDAVDLGVRLANAGDIVVAEGKGHEKSLAFGTTEYEYSDQEAFKRALRR